MNKHFVLTLALSIIMTLALSACSPRLHHFDQAEFVLKDSRASREYLNKDSMEEMDMHAFYAYGVSASTAEGTDYNREIILPIDLTYYAREDGQLVSAFTLTKGTVVSFEFKDIGRGIYSYPTRTKGLRYAKPFTVLDECADDNYYCVYLKDLETIARNTPAIIETAEGRGLKLEDAVFLSTRLIDRVFHEEGVFCSKD